MTKNAIAIMMSIVIMIYKFCNFRSKIVPVWQNSRRLTEATVSHRQNSDIWQLEAKLPMFFLHDVDLVSNFGRIIARKLPKSCRTVMLSKNGQTTVEILSNWISWYVKLFGLRLVNNTVASVIFLFEWANFRGLIASRVIGWTVWDRWG